MSRAQHRFSGVTTDGAVTFNEMRHTFERGYVAITFYTDDTLSTIATPTAGTVDVTISEQGDNFGTIPNGSEISAVTIATGANYSRPNWIGSVRYLKLTFALIAGAPYFRCTISQFGG